MSEQTEKPNRPIDINTELAKERTHDAFERTLMAWIRTGLSLIGFGLGMFEFIQKTGGTGILRSSKLVALLFILLGIAAVFLAIKDNRINHERLLNNDITYNRKSSLGIKVGYVLIGIGFLATIHVIFKIFHQ
jgi:putative membrane protein